MDRANAVLPPRPHAAPSVPSLALHLSSARFGASDQRECRLEILLPDRSPMCSLLFHFGKSLIFHWFSKGFWVSPRCSPCHGLCFSMFSSHSSYPSAVPSSPYRTFHFPGSHSQLRVKLAPSLSYAKQMAPAPGASMSWTKAREARPQHLCGTFWHRILHFSRSFKGISYSRRE